MSAITPQYNLSGDTFVSVSRRGTRIAGGLGGLVLISLIVEIIIILGLGLGEGRT